MGRIIFKLLLCAVLGAAGSPCFAETVPVTCVIQPDATSASVSLTNTLAHEASCLATCKFSTEASNDTPQIICAGPVAAGKEVELCVLHASANKLAKFIEGSADCRRF